MGIKNKISSFKYERLKRRQEKKIEKYNYRQEEYDSIYKNEKQKKDFKSLLSRLKFETYTKRLVGIVVIISLIDLQLSYVLAFLGREQIAETLSVQICVTLLGTILVYVIREYFDMKSEKHNELVKCGLVIDKNSSIIPNEVITNKVQEIISNSGLSEHINATNIMPQTENPDDSD